MGKKDKKLKKQKQVEEEQEEEIEQQEDIEEIQEEKKSKKKDKKNKKKQVEAEDEEEIDVEEKKQKKKDKKRKQKQQQSDDEEEEQEEKIEKKIKTEQQQQTQQQQDGQKYEVIVQGLSYESTEDDIKKLFIQKNDDFKQTIVSTKLLWDNINNRSRGTCFVVLNNQDSLNNIVARCNNLNFMGRNLRVQDAGARQKKQEINDSNSQAFKYSKTLRLRNLSFKADENVLKEYFEGCGAIEKVRLEKYKGKSRGYGHIDFQDREGLETALKKQGEEILGRAVLLDVGYPEKQKEEYNSERNNNYIQERNDNYNQERNENSNRDRPNRRQQNEGEGEESSTVFVGNLSFEVTEDQIQELMQNQGEIEEVRLAKYEDGSLKGFGFVKYQKPQMARDAVGLNGQEFQGRNLIIQVSQPRKQQQRN